MPHAQSSASLVTEVYGDLRRRASRLVDQQCGAIAPTSLVHEALEKLYVTEPDRWNDVVHFKATAAMAMRQVLLDRVKAGGRQKRGGDWQRVTLTDLGMSEDMLSAIDLHNALQSLENARPRCAEVVRLRILGGMELQEIESYLKLSLSTVKRDWRVGKAFLAAALAI